jgi:hypothetical protein
VGGIDAGRQSHHAAAVDEHGQVQWSMRVSNDQDAITALLGKVETGDEVTAWRPEAARRLPRSAQRA